MWKMKVRFAYEFAKYCTCMKYPIGIQTFDRIREDGYVYVDKTRLIYSMTHEGTVYFLSRPRRFGKSLLLSTLKNYFLGRRELFEGLEISKLEKEWKTYPVFHVDFGLGNYARTDSLDNVLNSYISEWERTYHVAHPAPTHEYSLRFHDVLKAAHAATGLRAVVLIDEYDKPLLDILDSGITLERSGERITLEEYNRELLRTLYTTFKAADEYLQFVMLTGVTKFSQVSVFSGFNQPNDISMDARYDTLCGITEEEMHTQMAGYIARLAEAKRKTYEETFDELKQKYDGYHFTWPSPDVYNPFSLLRAFTHNRMGSYWFESGTPTFLIEMLRRFNVVPSMLKPTTCMASSFDAPTEHMTSIIPLLYQSGYFTIKEYDELTNLYVLDLPNTEIRIGLMECLLPNYVQIDTYKGPTTVALMFKALHEDDLDGMLRLLQTYLLTIPQCDHTNYEGHYQQLLYVIFSLLGRYVDVEVRTATGRVDMVLCTAQKLYLFELKLNRSAEAAMQQIDLKNYPARFALCGLPVVKVGIQFDAEKHTLSEWQIEA